MRGRDDSEKDLYEVLGVAKDASQPDITSAYRRLARKWHPDAHGAASDAEARFKRISEAYSVLSDERKRAEYDRRSVRSMEADRSSTSDPGTRLHDRMEDAAEGLRRTVEGELKPRLETSLHTGLVNLAAGLRVAIGRSRKPRDK